MNNQPDRDGWTGAPQERMPALARAGEVAPRQAAPPPGYPGMAPGYGAPPQEEHNFVHDLLRYFWILVRHRWIVGGVVVFFLCVGLLVTFLSTPVYRASTTIQIERQAARIVDVESVQADSSGWYDDQFYETQYEILKSRSLAEQVASNLSLPELEAFTGYNISSPWTKVIQAVAGIFRPGGDTPAHDVDVPQLQMAAAYKVMGGLSVKPVGTSHVVRLVSTILRRYGRSGS